MTKNYKPIFIKAAIYTLVIFMLGILLGYILEEQRISSIEERYQDIELQWQDARIQSMYYQNIEQEECGLAIKENIIFSDEIYELGKKIDSYEDSNALTGEMTFEKKRHALLKTQFWLNNMVLKEKCNPDYINLVYFFRNEPDIEEKQKQFTQSDILREIKEDYGHQVMLIPLPIDMNVSMINIFIKQFEIEETPTILVDEEIKLEDVQSYDQIQGLVNRLIEQNKLQIDNEECGEEKQ